MMIIVSSNGSSYEIKPYCFDCGATEKEIEIVKQFNFAVLLRCLKCGNTWSKRLTLKNVLKSEKVHDIDYFKETEQHGTTKN